MGPVYLHWAILTSHVRVKGKLKIKIRYFHIILNKSCSQRCNGTYYIGERERTKFLHSLYLQKHFLIDYIYIHNDTVKIHTEQSMLNFIFFVTVTSNRASAWPKFNVNSYIHSSYTLTLISRNLYFLKVH